MDAAARVPAPVNEPVHDYAPGSAEREALERRLTEFAGEGPVELPHTVAGREVLGEGKPLDVVQPHARRSVLGTLRNATTDDARTRGGRRSRRRARPGAPCPSRSARRCSSRPRSC